MIRAFLAVELTEELRAHIAQIQQDLKHRLSRDTSHAVRISWTQPHSIHLTLKFLGDIDEQLIDPLRDMLSPITRSYPAIEIPIERLGAFPHLQQPRVLWVGPSAQWERGEEAQRLAALHRAVDESCETCGLMREGKPFSPHLTLARIKTGERRVGQLLAKSGVMDRLLSVGALAMKPVVLMKSELLPTGSVYTKLWEAIM